MSKKIKKAVQFKRNVLTKDAASKVRQLVKPWMGDENSDYLRDKKTRELMADMVFDTLKKKSDEDKKQKELKKTMIKAGTI